VVGEKIIKEERKETRGQIKVVGKESLG